MAQSSFIVSGYGISPNSPGKVTKMKLLFVSALLTIKLVSAQWDPNFATGRTTITHLFEWRWNDIAEECERFLGPYGYGGVQVSPVNENAVINDPPRPWWERYQPVSYEILTTRSGTEQEFASMVKRCNAVGVRIYVDGVLNHMVHHDNVGTGTGGSPFSGKTKQFPDFSPQDFHDRNHCPTASGEIEDHTDLYQVRNCELLGLTDLNQGMEYVKQHTADFLNKLVDYGVAGFRLDAAKMIWPDDLDNILKRVKDLPTEHGFAPGSRAFIYTEVIDMLNTEPIGGAEYYSMGRVTEFRYGKYLGEVFRGHTQLKALVNWGTEWGMHPDINSVVFIDNHDNQRGHGAGGDVVLTFRIHRLYKMATAFMLAHPFGIARVMSSYYWEQDLEENGNDRNSWVGPPANAREETLPVIINPDLTCGNDWMCEHRWRPIFNMVKFRNVVAGTNVNNWWDNGNNQIAFGRGNKGFIAINGENQQLLTTLQTGLPAGEYCDAYTSDIVNGNCTGRTIMVGSDGRAEFDIWHESEDPVIAIHVDFRV